MHDAADPAQQVFATYNGMGMPIGIKISDSMATQGGEAVSLACTQAMQDGYKKSQTISKSIESMLAHRTVMALHHPPAKSHYESLTLTHMHHSDDKDASIIPRSWPPRPVGDRLLIVLRLHENSIQHLLPEDFSMLQQ